MRGIRIGFQSTLPVRGATLTNADRIRAMSDISIHAPRAGSDSEAFYKNNQQLIISIHAPRAGSDWGVPGVGEL